MALQLTTQPSEHVVATSCKCIGQSHVRWRPPASAPGGMGKWPWLTSQWWSLQVPKLQEELEGLQKQADSLGAASEAALQEYQSLKQVSQLSWHRCCSLKMPLASSSGVFSCAASSCGCYSRARRSMRLRAAESLVLLRRLQLGGCITSARATTCSSRVPAAV